MPRLTVALALTAIVVPIAGVRVLTGSSPDAVGEVVGEADAATPTPIEARPPADEVVVPLIEPEPAAVSLTPDVTVIGASGEQQVAVDDAVARFRSAGLELPDVEIRFLADEAGCDGHLGLFQRGFTPWRVLVCSDLAFVPTHELAHAWEAANLDDDERARYVEARGMPTWDDRDADWNERGIEDAAFIVQQNLMAKHPNLDTPAWKERTAAYELLTGSSSPLGDPGALG
jgi:hypothetical protein